MAIHDSVLLGKLVIRPAAVVKTEAGFFIKLAGREVGFTNLEVNSEVVVRRLVEADLFQKCSDQS